MFPKKCYIKKTDIILQKSITVASSKKKHNRSKQTAVILSDCTEIAYNDDGNF